MIGERADCPMQQGGTRVPRALLGSYRLEYLLAVLDSSCTASHLVPRPSASGMSFHHPAGPEFRTSLCGSLSMHVPSATLPLRGQFARRERDKNGRARAGVVLGLSHWAIPKLPASPGSTETLSVGRETPRYCPREVGANRVEWWGPVPD